jgi:hypothetical protein
VTAILPALLPRGSDIYPFVGCNPSYRSNTWLEDSRGMTAYPVAPPVPSAAFPVSLFSASTLSLLTTAAHLANVPADCPVTRMSGC